MTVDPRAASGFGAPAPVSAYERGRPTYPQQAIDHFVRAFALTEHSIVLDLAAGTGKLARLLAPRVGRLIAVEPSPAMLAELRRRLLGVEARRGAAEAIPLEDASADAVTVGQAFHWFQAAPASKEIARVLRPGGGLGLIWNHEKWDLPWADEFRALTHPYRVAAGPFPADDDAWKDALAQSALFTPLRSAEFAHVHRVAADEFVALVASWSWIANLPVAERTDLLAQVRHLAGAHPQLALRYRTEVHWTFRIG